MQADNKNRLARYERLQRYEDFWPFYLREYSKATTRGLHYFGAGLGLLIALYTLISMTWWLLLAALVCGYFFAWIAHFFIEKNRPATFTYPLWSFAGDFRMFWFWLTGGARPGTLQARYPLTLPQKKRPPAAA